ncbi:MAG: ABC transporter permease subunit, partial [Pseudomonadota bacterium]
MVHDALVKRTPNGAGSTYGPALFWTVLAGLLLLATFAGPAWLRLVPDSMILPITDWVDRGLTWFAREATIGGIAVQQITRGFANLINGPIDATVVVLADGLYRGAGLNRTQAVPPLSWLAVGGFIILTGYRLGGVRLGLTCAIGTAFLVTFGLWHNAMVTVASVIVSAVLAIAIGLGLGVWSYRSHYVETVTRAVMNVMQTIPIFAYLIPTLLLFGYGPSAALIATVAYALPPMVHNTVIALRAVPGEVTECGIMSGCTPRQLLWQVQLPAALPGLAIGVNQAVMMTLNMVIIASMIGAGGLGFDVLSALRKLDIGSGLEAGAGIVVLAVILDRLTQAAAHRGAHGAGPVRGPFWRVLAGWIVLATLVALVFDPAQQWPKSWTLSTAAFWNELVSWINREFYDGLEAFRSAILLTVMRPFRDFLMGV